MNKKSMSTEKLKVFIVGPYKMDGREKLFIVDLKMFTAAIKDKDKACYKVFLGTTEDNEEFKVGFIDPKKATAQARQFAKLWKAKIYDRRKRK